MMVAVWRTMGGEILMFDINYPPPPTVGLKCLGYWRVPLLDADGNELPQGTTL